MVTVKDIYNYIDSFAPFETAEGFDNVGILVGNPNNSVSKALVALDITKGVVEEAEKIGAELIISHHPVIFSPLKRLSFDSVPAMLVSKGISAICAHTNLDKSEIFGVNTELAKALSLAECRISDKADILFVANTTNTMTSHEFAESIKTGLDCTSLSYTEVNNTITKVGFCSGAGGSEIFGAIAEKCDAFVTGEIKHHEIMAANENGVSVFCVGHYKSEDVVIKPLANKLSEAFSDVEFVKSKVFTDGVNFV